MKLFFLLFPIMIFATHPIQFAIPASKIVSKIPEKTRDFAHIIPGRPETYIYDDEESYYKGYQEALYGVTCKKGGWDCLRHYEILANGCIPYFLNLEFCDDKTMFFLPKDLILEAMNLEGVSHLKIDHEKFDRKRYDEILALLLEYTRKHLTTKAMAAYLLKTAGYEGEGKILFLSGNLAPDYQRCLAFHGLRELLGGKIIDVPKIEHLYDTYPKEIGLYGKGFSYARLLPELPLDRENIAERIKANEFDWVIYGSVHRGLPFHDLVKESFPPERIIYICGEDFHLCIYPELLHSSPFFLREFEGN